MDQPNRLSTLFMRHKPEGVTVPDDRAELEALLHQCWVQAGSSWPRVLLPDDAFVKELTHCLKRAGVEGPVGELLGQLHISDLYIVCACMKGVPGAKEALENSYLSKVPAWLEKYRLSKDEMDDIRQTLLINLLMGTPKAGPKLATYGGKGQLESWIRVSAVRMAWRRGNDHRKPIEENALALFEAMPAQHPDPEMELILSRYRAEFRKAYIESLSELGEEQKLLLLMYFLKKMTTTELGKLFGVKQSTVWRRLQNVQKAVYEATKLRLQKRLKLTSGEFKSLLAAIRSQFDASISQILKEEREKGEDDQEKSDEDEGHKEDESGEKPPKKKKDDN